MTSRILRSMSVKDEAGSQNKGLVPKEERQNVRIKGSVLKKPPPSATERTRQSPNVSEIMKGRLKAKLQVNNTKYNLVEAALRRQFISVRRHSRDSRYAAFLRTHCAYTLFSHMCYNRYPPHRDSNILYSTLLLASLFGCVVYASATLVTDSTRSPSKHGASQTPSAAR